MIVRHKRIQLVNYYFLIGQCMYFKQLDLCHKQNIIARERQIHIFNFSTTTSILTPGHILAWCGKVNFNDSLTSKAVTNIR